ncbi:Dot/Icm T4SS effector AnkD/LegA15 [Legionella fallonii]|uniref:Substrate of the Dot/Icm secretion system n=1 Tax=Legionella fallonii LLAP-10 TaxID=1212491 RepID=A0A098G3J5_9GAMM|nr:Dot/Icm T4SS effector AnkD/LegA15 [Legionella fallonii]CEG56546.1 conserved protein of unknown function [Legionella fallonii LLAP-10]
MSSSSDDVQAPFKLFGDIRSQANDSNLKEIQKKGDEQKALLIKQITDKITADQNLFFSMLMRLLGEKQQQDTLRAELEREAQKCGFSNLQQAINVVRNPDGQSPLQQAFQQQDFGLAQRLIDYGAIPGPIERAAFDVALDSKAAKDFGFTPQYAKEDALHPVKDYGLVLGIEMTSKDGTYSQFGHIGPTYQLMTDSVNKYAMSGFPADKGFQEIADAYKFSNKAAGFSYSTATRDPQAGQEIADRIKQGKTTTIPISFEGHAMGLSVVPDGPNSKSGYLVFTNRGLGKKPGEEGTQIYRVDDLSKIDAKFINSAMNGHSNGASHRDIMGQIRDVTGGKPPVHTIQQKDQKYDNCSIANTRSNIHGILVCQKAKEKGVPVDKLGQDDLDSVKKDFKKFTKDMRTDKVKQLTEALKNNPQDADLNNLAKEYLKKPSKVSNDVRESLEKALSSNAQSSQQVQEQRPMTLSKM